MEPSRLININSVRFFMWTDSNLKKNEELWIWWRERLILRKKNRSFYLKFITKRIVHQRSDILTTAQSPQKLYNAYVSLKKHIESNYKTLNAFTPIPISNTLKRHLSLAVDEEEKQETNVSSALSEKEMATVIGSAVRWSRLKIEHFRQFSRNFSTKTPINRKLNESQNYLCYLVGGSVLIGSYFKWQQSNTVFAAFNPKKIKVSEFFFVAAAKYLFLNIFLGSSSSSSPWKYTFTELFPRDSVEQRW